MYLDEPLILTQNTALIWFCHLGNQWIKNCWGITNAQWWHLQQAVIVQTGHFCVYTVLLRGFFIPILLHAWKYVQIEYQVPPWKMYRLNHKNTTHQKEFTRAIVNLQKLLVVSQTKHPTFNTLDLIHTGDVENTLKGKSSNSNSHLNWNLRRTALGHTRISLLRARLCPTGDN